MKLLRNIPERKGRCKYALIRLDKLGLSDAEIGLLTPSNLAIFLASTLKHPAGPALINELIEFGEPGSENEFFAIKLKDISAEAALNAYALKACETDRELAESVAELVLRSGPNNINCKVPD